MSDPIKRVRKALAAGPTVWPFPVFNIREGDLRALLDRLDAAERECEQLQKWKREQLELEKTLRRQIDCAHDEVMRLREWEACAREWLDKTEWVQTKDLLPRYLGMHRADIMRDEIGRLREDAERYRWLTDDHPRHETRARVYEISSNLNMRGKGHIDAAIDAARKEK